MVHQSDMTALRERLEALRDRVAQRDASEAEVWSMLEHAGELVDKGKGGPYEESLNLIHALVESVWSTVRAQEKLHDLLGPHRN